MALRPSSLVLLAVGALLAVPLAGACASSTVSSSGSGGSSSSSTGGAGGAGADGGFSAIGGGGAGSGGCECAPGPHNDVVYTLSDDGEIWAFDPATNQLSYVRSLLCAGAGQPFSMAIDQQGKAWVLASESDLIFTFDLSDDQGCEVAPYTPKQAGYDLFGMSFAGPPASCPDIYTFSYSGNGPFSEGPGIGELGVIDEEGVLTALSPVDYDGGELAGTGDGRLFAFTGNQPSKLVEYDRQSGAAIQTIPLTGFEKTNASAFAFFAGSVYFFTEASPGCDDCLTQTCPADYAACQADPMCLQQLQCAIGQGDITDECGGFMPQGMIDCVSMPCANQCLLPSTVKVSQVTRFDLADHQGGDPDLQVVVPELPIRVVGAGDSVCVPPTPL